MLNNIALPLAARFYIFPLPSPCAEGALYYYKGTSNNCINPAAGGSGVKLPAGISSR